MAYDINFKKACYTNMETSKIIDYLEIHIKRYKKDTKSKTFAEINEYETDKILLDYYIEIA